MEGKRGKLEMGRGSKCLRQRTCSLKARGLSEKEAVRIKVRGKKVARVRERERSGNIEMERDESKENK